MAGSLQCSHTPHDTFSSDIACFFTYCPSNRALGVSLPCYLQLCVPGTGAHPGGGGPALGEVAGGDVGAGEADEDV